jgi:hypothetical protein
VCRLGRFTDETSLRAHLAKEHPRAAAPRACDLVLELARNYALPPSEDVSSLTID